MQPGASKRCANLISRNNLSGDCAHCIAGFTLSYLLRLDSLLRLNETDEGLSSLFRVQRELANFVLMRKYLISEHQHQGRGRLPVVLPNQRLDAARLNRTLLRREGSWWSPRQLPEQDWMSSISRHRFPRG